MKYLVTNKNNDILGLYNTYQEIEQNHNLVPPAISMLVNNKRHFIKNLKVTKIEEDSEQKSFYYYLLNNTRYISGIAEINLTTNKVERIFPDITTLAKFRGETNSTIVKLLPPNGIVDDKQYIFVNSDIPLSVNQQL